MEWYAKKKVLTTQGKALKASAQSNEGHPSFIKDLLTAILRHSLGRSRDGRFRFMLSGEQQRSLQALVNALQKKDKEASRCRQSFLWAVVSTKDRGGWMDIIQQWLWLKTLQADRNFYGPSSLMPDLAKVKDLIQQMTLLQAVMQPLRSGEGLFE